MNSIHNGGADVPSGQPFFDGLYEQHRRALHAYFFGRTGDREAAEDLLQEIFLRVWHNLPILRELDPDRCRYWLFAVARNLLTDHYRTQTAQLVAEQELSPHPQGPLCSLDGPAAKLEQEEELRLLDMAIRRLPDDLRTVLVMQALEKMSSAQIGEMLDRPAGTIRYQISLARKRLAEEMRLLQQGTVQEEDST